MLGLDLGCAVVNDVGNGEAGRCCRQTSVLVERAKWCDRQIYAHVTSPEMDELIQIATCKHKTEGIAEALYSRVDKYTFYHWN
jgi:hypothetical protein